MAAVAAALAVSAACGGGGDSETPSAVEGRVVALDYEAARLRRFTVRDESGEEHELVIADDVSYGFDLDHLREHRASGDPVRCTVEDRDGRLVALSIEDA